jgi:hypothetical protein
MHLTLDMAKMAKESLSHTAIEGTKYLIKKPRCKVREQKKRTVESAGHKKLTAATERHPARLGQNQTSCNLPCHNGTTMNPQSGWRR